MPASALDTLSINTIRFLSADAVQKANSGHPGLPMGAAPMAYVLWTRFLAHDPADPTWPDRDRFVLSAGHGSMLLYSLLHLTGYDLSLEEIKKFRRLGSRTPGHPERDPASGVEITTGPLGQGLGNAVGMAIAEAHLAARFNRPGHTIVDHYTYVLASDGDLMEGVGAEACSLAGHLGLGKLVVLYDDNRVSLAGSTSICFTEDVAGRFAAYGWHVERVPDGNDIDAVAKAIERARAERARPSLLVVRTHIGYGAPHKQDTFEVHGSPLGEEELRAAKQNLGWPLEPSFLIPPQALEHFRRAVPRGQELQREWSDRLAAYKSAFPDLAAEFERRITGALPAAWDRDLPSFPADAKGLATRQASGAPAVGAHGARYDLGVHARQHRPRGGRTDPSAGRALRRAARRPGAPLHPPVRRRRDGVGLEGRDREPSPPDRARAHAPERADPRPHDVRAGRRPDARRLRAQPGCVAFRHHPARHRLGGAAHRRRRAAPRPPRRPLAPGLHAVLGALRRAAGGLPRQRAAAVRRRAAGRGDRRRARLAPLGRPARRDTHPRPFRCVGAGCRRHARLRLHGRERHRARARPAVQARRMG